MVRRFRIRLFRVGGRLRARLERVQPDGSKSVYGEWWVETKDFRRYGLKSIPRNTLQIIFKTDMATLEDIISFLRTGSDGDVMEFEVRSDRGSEHHVRTLTSTT